VWQTLRSEWHPQGLEIVTVALDTTGTEAARPWIEACTGYLDHPFKNKPFETEKDLLPLLANAGRSVYNPKLSLAYSYSYTDIFT
jgi:hypothetical protein